MHKILKNMIETFKKTIKNMQWYFNTSEEENSGGFDSGFLDNLQGQVQYKLLPFTSPLHHLLIVIRRISVPSMTSCTVYVVWRNN